MLVERIHTAAFLRAMSTKGKRKKELKQITHEQSNNQTNKSTIGRTHVFGTNQMRTCACSGLTLVHNESNK